MGNTVYIAQIVGTISVLLLFVIKLVIVSNPILWAKSGRIASLWTIIYVFFLFVLRIFSLFHLADIDSLRLISGYSSLLPLLGVISHLFLFQHAPSMGDSLEEVRHLVDEAKGIKREADEMLENAKSNLKQRKTDK